MLYFNPQSLIDLGVAPLLVLVAIPISIIISLAIVKFVYSQKTYKCTECESTFVPTFMKTHLGFYNDPSLSGHGRNQYCPKCRKITWCKYVDK